MLFRSAAVVALALAILFGLIDFTTIPGKTVCMVLGVVAIIAFILSLFYPPKKRRGR